MEKQSYTNNEVQSWKQQFLSNHDSKNRPILKKLWEKLEARFNFYLSLEIMHKLSQNYQEAKQMVRMSQKEFFAKCERYKTFQNQSQDVINNEKMIMEPQEKATSQKDKTKQTESLMIPQDNIDITVYSKFLIENNIENNSQFNRRFNLQDFKSFFHFYLEYNQLQILRKSEIKKQSQTQIKKQDNTIEGLKRQILLTDSALYYTSPRYRLRPTQIMAIYFFLIKPELKKILLQIFTGEGKSTTIACLSAILVFRGFEVDIITTSPILVKRDVQQKRDFFDLLGMKIDHNVNEDTKDCLKPKGCYEGKNIVMGTPFSFQVDLLYDEYQQKGTRNKRPYKVAIIDEVDSMLIDEKSNQTLLASSFAGFSELILPMRKIWQTIVSKDIIKEDDKIYLYQKGQKHGQIIKGEAIKVMRVMIDELREKFNNQFIPKWRLQFIQYSLEDWIHSAITAAHIYMQNHHYIVEKGKIVPVNYRSNGVLQRNVHWQNGLHQFLQMKHGIHVQIETMTSNFMSNIGHFNRYQNLYGLTGTLGSAQSKIFLQFTYNVEMLQIPPYIERRLQIQPGYLMFADLQWIKKITQQTKKMIDNERAVLIICQTIQDTEIVLYALKQKKVNYKNLRIFKTGQQNHQDTIDSKEIIIATNVAGRGTDIKAKQKLIQKGGLHVIISFMPQNYRVQMQARGRAGRNGAPGSSQLIVNYQKYCEQIGLQTFQQSFFIALGWQHDIRTFCQNYRDKIEAELMKNDKETVKKLKTKDKMFQFFCQAVKKIPDYTQNTAKKHAIQQAWAMFLKKVQLFKCTDEQMEQQAQNLTNEFIKNSEGFYNPSHGVWRGLNSYSKNNFDEAKKHFKNLQSQDSTKINKIAGCLLEAAVKINQDDKKKKSQYQSSVNLLQNAFKICEQKKQIQKANHALRMTIDNQNSLNFLQNQAQIKLQQSIRMISQKDAQSLDLNFVSNQKVDEIQRKQMNRLLNSPTINILNSIQQHIKIQTQRIANVKPDEYVQMNLKSLKSIINLQEKDQKNEDLKDAYQNLAPDLPYIPEAQIKKIPKEKTPWWKRALVFCLGVIQICVGSLIVASSGGAAASFGSFMIYEGLSDCYKALFKPQLCNDLKAYFTEKVIGYSISLASIGLSGIQQLAKIGGQGFSIIKNSSMQEIFKKTVQNISTGFAKGIVNYQGAIRQQIFKGISSKLMSINQKKQQIKPQDIFRIVKQPDFKKKVKQAQKQEEKLQFDGKKIQQKFSSDFQSIIKTIIEKNLSKFIQEVRNLNLKPELVSALIKISFQQNYEQIFYKNQTEENKLMQKKIYHFVSKNLHNQKLAQKIITQFKIEKLILDSMKNIGKNQYYNKLIKQSKIQIYNNIITFFNQITKAQKQKLSTEITAIKNEQNMLNTSAMTPDQFNSRVSQYNSRVQKYKNNQDSFNKFIGQVNSLPKDEKMVDHFINKGIIENGKINKYRINQSTELHPFLKQALLKLEDIKTSQKDFKQDLTNIAFNTFSKIVVQSVNQIIDNSSNSISRLKDIENKLYKDLYESN